MKEAGYYLVGYLVIEGFKIIRKALNKKGKRK